MKSSPLHLIAGGISLLVVSAIMLVQCNNASTGQTASSSSSSSSSSPAAIVADPIFDNAKKMLEEGRQVFRFETFGDEAYWTDALQLNKSIAGEKNGGVGPGLSPKAALAAGLKVDMEVIPADVAQ